jgi:CHAT domain-containing protein
MRSRALVLDEMLQRRHVVGQSTSVEVAELLENVNRSSERLARVVLRGPSDRDDRPYRAILESARMDKERAEVALAAHSHDFRERLTVGNSGLHDVVAALPPGSALIAFVRYKSFALSWSDQSKPAPLRSSTPYYAAFIVRASGTDPVAVRLGEADRIDGLIARWRATTALEALAAGRASAAGVASNRSAGEELRRAVWDPVARHLGAAQQLLIVPDGTLNLVTFAALPVGEARYLVEEGRTFHYLSSERDALAPRSDAKGGGLLALSNPDFDDPKLFAALGPPQARTTSAPEETIAAAFRGSRSACGTFPSMRFGPLPATAVETSEIIRVWGTYSIPGSNVRHDAQSAETAESFTGAAASETMFKRIASGHRVLHLATHGFFLGGDCESTFDSPAADGKSPASGTVTRENPLLLSGLVLAGANRREAAGPDEDDGILTAEEIATLNLQGTEWAVLSACDTGTGEIRAGEGVFGLRRAFQLAGARTVIMSLWPVEDEATRQWMTALYRHRFGEGKTTAASVNDASRELLQQRRARGESTHPFYWAGFIAAGDWR